MGVKTRAKQPEKPKDEEERGATDASSSPQEETKPKRRSPRTRKAIQEASKEDPGKKKVSKGSEDRDAATTRGHRKTKGAAKDDAEPMETEEPEKQSKDAKSNGDSQDPAEKHHHKHHHHHHLNEETLKRLKTYLLSERMHENLDEDAIAVKILRTDRATSERVRFLHDPYADSDDEEDAPDQSYQAAEDYTLALDFYKRAIAEVQEENPDASLDKKTLNWLRKALGLHRRNELYEQHQQQEEAQQTDESEDELDDADNGSQGKPRRLVTRGMVRSTRIKRRAERATKESMNLNALLSAVGDLEGEFGPFAESPQSSGQKKRKRPKDSDDENTGNRSSKPKPSRKKPKPEKKKKPPSIFDRDLMARLPRLTKEVTKSGRKIKRIGRAEKSKYIKVQVKIGGKHIQFFDLGREKQKRKRSLSPSTLDVDRRRQKAALRKRQRKAAAAASKAKGHLFGEMDPYRAMDLNSADYVEESGHISLGLLEWKRRQQGDTATNKEKGSMPEMDQEPVSTLPRKLARAGLRADLPLWDSVNPIPSVQRQPATAEPPRRRHSDAKYADWISTMVNVLTGSGRSWALHEFFYSDIDRAWFNFDQFQVDVAKLGIPPTARLTRKEWSLVRRSIRKRPRRFSRRFIQSELAKLCQYRDIVRAVQHSGSPMPDFGFEVPAYIRVGATVTAIHWKRRVLHRGVVLGHDPRRSGYLVQFERQELGFQFCPDYEVASHGVPVIAIEATDTSLGGTNLGAFFNRHGHPGELSYGTSYGPMYADQVDPIKVDKQRKVALLDAVIAHGSTKDGEGDKRQSFPNDTLVERVAERETLVELIGTIDAALKRKAMLLDAIEKSNQDVASLREKFGPDYLKSAKAESSDYMSHYSWLQANLRLTNQTLESSLVLLQTMYGKAYTGMRREESADEEDEELESQLQRLCEEDEVDKQLVVPWSLSMAKASEKVGSLVARTAHDLARKWDSMSEEEKLRSEYIEHSLSAACRLLLNANYCGALVRSERADVGSEKGLTLNVAPMKACLDRELRSLSQKPMPPSTGNEPNIDKLYRADDVRVSAMKDLQEALSAYETELAATHVAKKIIRS